MYCECGCGSVTNIIKVTNRSRGLIAGEYRRYVVGHQQKHALAKRRVRTHCRHGHLLPEIGRLACPTCHGSEYRRELRARHPEKSRAYAARMKFKYALRDYGITRDEYEAMVARQGGRCAICHENPRPVRGCIRLHVDHDHVTGKVRGLLCQLCNLALGKFRDDPRRLMSAIHYLAAQQAELVADVAYQPVSSPSGWLA